MYIVIFNATETQKRFTREFSSEDDVRNAIFDGTFGRLPDNIVVLNDRGRVADEFRFEINQI